MICIFLRRWNSRNSKLERRNQILFKTASIQHVAWCCHYRRQGNVAKVTQVKLFWQVCHWHKALCDIFSITLSLEKSKSSRPWGEMIKVEVKNKGKKHAMKFNTNIYINWQKTKKTQIIFCIRTIWQFFLPPHSWYRLFFLNRFRNFLHKFTSIVLSSVKQTG